MIDWNAPRLKIAKEHIYGIRSEWYAAIFKVHFVPVHHYQVDAPKPEDGEIGALCKMRGLRITKVVRRVIGPVRRKK